MEKEFYEGQLVIYAPTGADGKIYKTQVGRVKRMSADKSAVFVYYHAGGTAACTPIQHVYAIENCMYLKIDDALNSLD